MSRSPKITKYRILLCFLIVLFLPNISIAMTTKGRITYDDGQPVADTKVQLWDEDFLADDHVKTTTTNSNGDYTFSHKKRQDPWWNGKKRRKGDFYIKIRKGGKTLKRSRTHKNYKPATLTINLEINRALAEYGKNTVYGRVTILHPNGETSPAQDFRVRAVDKDVLFHDELGEVKTDNAGDYVIQFSDSDYRPCCGLGGLEDQPDIYVRVFQWAPSVEGIENGGGRETFWSEQYNEAELPKKIDAKLIEVVVKGTIGLYTRTDGDTTQQESVERLVALLYNDNSHVGSKDTYLAKANVETKGRAGIFTLRTYGRNESNGNDLYVVLYDVNTKEPVWESERYWNLTEPETIELNGSNSFAVRYELPPPEEEEEIPTGGTVATILYADSGTERSNECVFEVRAPNGDSTLLIYPGDYLMTDVVPCGQTHLYQVFCGAEPASSDASIVDTIVVQGSCSGLMTPTISLLCEGVLWEQCNVF